MTNVQQTSLFAFHDVKHNLSDRQRHVYTGMRAMNRDFSDKELAEFLEMPINQITPRRGELVKMGIVRSAGRRLCRAKYSSPVRPVQVWEVGKIV